MKTNLSILQITQVTGQLSGKALCVTSDLAGAIDRLIKACARRFEDPKGIPERLLNCQSAVEACRLVATIKETRTMNDETKNEEAAEAAPKKAPRVRKEKAEKPPKEPKAPKAPKEKTSGIMRARHQPDDTIHSLVNENPRREGCAGWQSFEIILGNPGLTVAEFRALGGRNNDLHWDEDRDRVEVRKAAAKAEAA